MPPIYFPLRWESTGEQWWYASPIDWAAADGHYDLVRELLRIDINHLINLTSLRRIRRLESVWDDEEHFHHVAKCRAKVARKLFQECEFNKAKNSLIQAGYGGWLMYTAALAGDSIFVQDLLARNSLLVFGEGEYGVTDILYAAAKGKNSDVFQLVYDFAVSPRFLTSNVTGELAEQLGEIPEIYRWEMMNRAVHAAARGGNSTVLKELLNNCSDVSAYRDKHGSTVLHSAAAQGQVEVIKYLVRFFDIIDSTDNHGNTALHIAAYTGQSSSVEALIATCPSLISSTNYAGETLLHMAVSGFSTPTFRRLDKQIHLIRQLISGKIPNMEDIINAKNNDGRTALHMAIVANVHSELVQLLMSAPRINLNAHDAEGVTVLDLLKQRLRSASSDRQIRELTSARGKFGCQDYGARRAIVSRLKQIGNAGSTGTSFTIADTEIFLYTGIEIAADSGDQPAAAEISPSYLELSKCDSSDENKTTTTHRRRSSVNYAVQRLKMILHWPRVKEKMAERSKKSMDHHTNPIEPYNFPGVTPIPTPLRQRFSNASSPSPSSSSKNKRTLSVRSNPTSPTPVKKLTSVHWAEAQASVGRKSRSSSFSMSSISSSSSLDKEKGIANEIDVPGPSCKRPNIIEKTAGSNRGKLRRQYLCFGSLRQAVDAKINKHRRNLSANNPPILSLYSLEEQHYLKAATLDARDDIWRQLSREFNEIAPSL